MGKINYEQQYVVYVKLCELVGEEPKALNCGSLDIHLNSIIREFIKKGDITIPKWIECYETVDLSVYDTIEYILNYEPSDEYIPLDFTEDEIEDWEKRFIEHQNEVLKQKVVKRVNKKVFSNKDEMIERVNNYIKSIQDKFEYTPPFYLQLVAFIPYFQKIIKKRQKVHYKKQWSELDDETKDRFTTWLYMEQYITNL